MQRLKAGGKKLDAYPIHVAVESGNEAMVRLLLENGASVNVKNLKKKTPAMLAKKLPKKQPVSQRIIALLEKPPGSTEMI